MSPLNSARVVKVTERGECAIDFADLVNLDGSLKLLDHARNKGFLEVKYTQDSLRAKVGGIVGRLPIAPSLTLDIEPKFPISNLSRMIAISNEAITRSVPTERFYATQPITDCFPESLLRAYAHYLGALITEGIQREYKRTTHSGHPRPRINFHQTQQKYWSRGKPLEAVYTTFEFSADIALNQLLKVATQRGLALLRHRSGADKEKRIFIEALELFHRVDARNFSLQQMDVATELRKVPSFREYYNRAAPLAFELLKRSSVLYEATSYGVVMPSYLIELERIFESYIRNVLFTGFSHDNRLRVRDGNHERWQRPLLKDNKRYRIKPDLVLLNATHSVLAIGDVKYKPAAKEEDRYQIISHALSYQADKAILIYPSNTPALKGLFRLGAIGTKGNEIQLYEYHFDLAGDLEAQERALVHTMEELLVAPVIVTSALN